MFVLFKSLYAAIAFVFSFSVFFFNLTYNYIFPFVSIFSSTWSW